MRVLTFTFEELGIEVSQFNGQTPKQAYRDIVQIVCDYIMDEILPEFSESDVFQCYNDFSVDWVVGTILVPINDIYKPEYLH